MQDGASPHITIEVKQFLKKKMFTDDPVLSHHFTHELTSYLLDLMHILSLKLNLEFITIAHLL